METIKRFVIFEIRLKTDTIPVAVFSLNEKKITVKGFRISDTEYAVRFMPDQTGIWNYSISSMGIADCFECVNEDGSKHGIVVTSGFNFEYQDKTPFFPVGTTCYAWIHQQETIIEKTLWSLSTAPFNKVRMCIFPKSMPYNHNEPELFPYYKDKDGKWDLSKPDFRFWDHLDCMIHRLDELGIEADLILFHPYDRWGFSTLNCEECVTYLDYCLCRLSAHRNIWWSLANEYDLLPAREARDWELFGEKIKAEDPYHHLLSIHHCFRMYPPTEWMTHCSVQSSFIKRIKEWRDSYNRPIIIDECGYEGNIEFEWGNLSGFELVNRAWTAVTSGGFITHGETFLREDEVLWWAKGGWLVGQSTERFAFLKSIQYELGNAEPYHSDRFVINPNESNKDPQAVALMDHFEFVFRSLPEFDRRLLMMQFSTCILQNKDYRLQYIGRQCPSLIDLQLPEEGSYRVEVIDVWEMSRTITQEKVNGNICITLPSKEGIAILVSRLEGEPLDQW